MIIKNGNVLHIDRFALSTDIQIENKTIERIQTDIIPEPGEEVIDASGCYVLPGLVDLHTHGLKDIAVDTGSLIDFAELQYEQGVTSCIVTLGGSPQENIRTMQNGLIETDNFKKTPNIAGFRPEMTYLVDASAGNPDSLSAINSETTESLYTAGEGWIKIWDVSPELPGAIEFIRWARKKGIITSLAHSNALEDIVRPAVDAGMRLVTHFYDLFPLPVEVDEGVYPAGVTDYINLEDRLVVEIIPDGVHVHPYLLEQTIRVKGPERVVFITDSALGSGNPPDIYGGLYPGIQVEVTEDRGIRRIGDDLLSCSALTMLAGFKNTVFKFGKSIPEASKLCSRNAARLIGLGRKGYIGVGMDADIIILDNDLNLLRTVVLGRNVYKST
jgi:N-acetylglucosamine-6-phosphate deacetylase